jgi:hypothetical protein
MKTLIANDLELFAQTVRGRRIGKKVPRKGACRKKAFGAFPSIFSGVSWILNAVSM